MAVSMHRYVSLIAQKGKAKGKSKGKGKGKSKSTLPEGFDGKTFEEQAKRMLVLFELHKGLSDLERKTQIFANPGADYKGAPISPSAEFSRYIQDRNRSFLMLQPWDAATIPFSLVPKDV